MTYIGQLVEAGWTGASSVRKQAAPNPSTWALLAPATVGLGVGVLAVALQGRRRSTVAVTLAAAIGGAIGLGVGAAWATRGTTGAAARAALRGMDTVRDNHLLEKHPISYA